MLVVIVVIMCHFIYTFGRLCGNHTRAHRSSHRSLVEAEQERVEEAEGASSVRDRSLRAPIGSPVIGRGARDGYLL